MNGDNVYKDSISTRYVGNEAVKLEIVDWAFFKKS